MGYFKEAAKGITWMGLLRGLIRLVGFFKIAILARLLSPFQFGLFGIASLVLAFLEILTETGINIVLVQEKERVDKYLNTAWVVSIIRGIFISCIIFLCAPLISVFFNSSESMSLIRLISVAAFLRGFINPSVVKFQKELQFNKEFLFKGSIFFVDALTSVVLTLLLKSPVALIWGVIIGVIFELLLSFFVVKPRPKLSFEAEKLKKIINKGKYFTLAGIFNYLSEHIDDAVVGKLINASSLGLYQVAYKISSLPITEISEVVGKVTFPVYVKISDDKKRLRKAFFKTSFTMFLFVFPFGLSFYFFPKQIIHLLLGDAWLEASLVLRVLALFGIIRACLGFSYSLFLSLNKQNYVAVITFLQMIILSLSIIPLVNNFGLLGAGYSSLLAVLFALPLAFWYLFKLLKV